MDFAVSSQLLLLGCSYAKAMLFCLSQIRQLPCQWSLSFTCLLRHVGDVTHGSVPGPTVFIVCITATRQHRNYGAPQHRHICIFLSWFSYSYYALICTSYCWRSKTVNASYTYQYHMHAVLEGTISNQYSIDLIEIAERNLENT